MANNTLFLVHAPTGKFISLAKHFCHEWQRCVSENELDTFFNSIKFGSENCDFVLALEEPEDSKTINHVIRIVPGDICKEDLKAELEFKL